MNAMTNRASRFAAGGLLALAALALPRTVMAYDPVLMCDETQTRIVCCAVDGGQIKSCQIIPK